LSCGIEKMNQRRECLSREQGMILITVLLLLTMLMVLGMAAVGSVQNDFRMTSNLRGSTAAGYLADAGVEWAKDQVALATTMPPSLSDATRNLSLGSYSVSFLRSIQTFPLAAQVVVRSVGNTGNASQTVQARIAKAYELSDAAVVLRGNSRSINFAGASFLISGFDHDLINGVPLTASRPRPGITVGGANLLNQVNGALNNVQMANITGDDGHGSVITASRHIPASDVFRFASDLCAAPNAMASSIPALGSLSVTSQTWGSRSVPQLRCVNGLPGSTDSVIFGANTGGAGILVIRDAELVLTRDFRWEGWVIISGSDVGFQVVGSDNKDLLGALIVHESGNGTGSGPGMVNIQGALRVQFSRQALSLTTSLIPPATLSASYAALPFFLKQEYWRSLDP
jgi:Tfp pilus assembly protein PilX